MRDREIVKNENFFYSFAGVYDKLQLVCYASYFKSLTVDLKYQSPSL